MRLDFFTSNVSVKEALEYYHFVLNISDGVKDRSLKAKAKTKDFKIVLEDPRGRGLSSRTPTLVNRPILCVAYPICDVIRFCASNFAM